MQSEAVSQILDVNFYILQGNVLTADMIACNHQAVPLIKFGLIFYA